MSYCLVSHIQYLYRYGRWLKQPREFRRDPWYFHCLDNVLCCIITIIYKVEANSSTTNLFVCTSSCQIDCCFTYIPVVSVCNCLIALSVCLSWFSWITLSTDPANWTRYSWHSVSNYQNYDQIIGEFRDNFQQELSLLSFSNRSLNT